MTVPHQTLLACAILACTVLFAPQRVLAQQDRSGELQGLVNALGSQLDRVGKVDGREADKRRDQLREVLDRWNDSPRSDDDYRAMEAWLRTAIRASLAGHSRRMPELPEFNDRTAPQEPLPMPEEPTRNEPPAVAEPQPVAEVQPKDPLEVEPPAAAEADQAMDEPAESTATVDASPSVWQQHPAAQPIDLGDPFVDDSQVADAPLTQRTVLRPAIEPSRPSVSSVSVNAAELKARVRGYVRGLRGIEARLVSDRDLDVDQLMSLVRELQNLSDQRDFVSLYLDTMDSDTMDSATTRSRNLPSMGDSKALIAKRLDRHAGDPEKAAAVESLRSALRRLAD